MASEFHADLRPPYCDEAETTFPAQHVMLVTIVRAKKMNTTNHLLNWQLDTVWKWFDEEPALRVAIITGEGTKAFCAGSDLIEIESAQKDDRKPWLHTNPESASAGLARRKGKKPILASVNGIALGGGFEIVLNRYDNRTKGYGIVQLINLLVSDIAVASPHAQFSLPEPSVGVYAWSGGLPRLVRQVGMQAASDIALTGRRISAQEALDLRLITAISESPLDDTIAKAKQIASISPDGIIVTRAALREAWETASVERAFQITHDEFYETLMKSDNSQEGLAAFREKRKPKWTGSKL